MGVGTSGRGRRWGKGCGRVNILQILCTHVCIRRMIPVETIPGIGEGGIKEKGGGSEFRYDIFDIL
jgi:hypothetical protein